MDSDATALFRELADRSPSEREDYYARHHVPAALRAEVESLLQFDGDTVDALHGYVASAVKDVLLGEHGSVPLVRQAPPVVGSTTSHQNGSQASSEASEGRFPAGTLFGRHYRVLALLGRGGMGEVYLARDTTLGRDVALKLLRPEVAADADRLARFSREAHVLAGLNHPNIAAIYAVEESHNTRALVLELVDGETLAERIARGPIALDDALGIAAQIAAALEAAHERGIVHRDLKPANIKIAGDGVVKVLDFGVAKLAEGSAAEDSRGGSHALSTLPPITSPAVMTHAGVLVGTAGYMSPEQAQGKAVDARADIWAFGVILFEMLTGEQPFAAETFTGIVNAVLTREVPITRVPGHVQLALARCLERNPRKRLRHIGDFELLVDAAAPASGVREPARRQRSWLAATVLTAAVMGGVALVAGRWNVGVAPEGHFRRFGYPVAGLEMTNAAPPALSPDGRKFLYVANGTLWLQFVDELEPRALVSPESVDQPNTPAPLSRRILYPFWAADSAEVGYFFGSRVWAISLAGGRPRPIANYELRIASTPGAVWTRDGRIMFAPATTGSGLFSVSAQGGEFAEAVPLDAAAEGDLHKPSLLPDGQSVLFVIDHLRGGPDAIGVLANGSRKTVFRSPGDWLDSPVYSPTGHLLYARGGSEPSVWAVPFSMERLEITGDPFLVAADAGWPTTSANGTLLYTRGAARMQLTLLSRGGQVQGVVGDPQSSLRTPRFSRDGTRVAAIEGAGVVVYDLRRKTKSRVAFDRLELQALVWSVADDRLIYQAGGSSREDTRILSVPASGGGGTQLLAQHGVTPTVSDDGRWLAFATWLPDKGFKIFYQSLSGESERVAFRSDRGEQSLPALTPDGRYLAYVSDESGRREIWLARFPSGDAKWQVTTRGASANPVWDASGSRLMYRDGDTIIEIPIALDRERPTIGVPRRLVSGLQAIGWDVSPDGRTILAIRPFADPTAKPPTLVLVEHWEKGVRSP